MTQIYFDGNGNGRGIYVTHKQNECRDTIDYSSYDIPSNWKSEKEMNMELSKLLKESGYTVIDEFLNTKFTLLDNGKKSYLKGNNGVDLTVMINNKMVIIELKNSGSGFNGIQGLSQLMYYMEQDDDYMEWRKKMGIKYNDYRILKHSKLIGILILADGRNIKYLLKIIKKVDYPIKLLVFNPVILRFESEKDRFIKSLKEAIE